VSTTHALDIDALLQPVPGDDPAGDPRAYAHRLRDELHELRREDDPADYDEATRPAQWKHADWNGVIDVARQALICESKDLRIACHLAEALVQSEGLEGLRQSLELLQRMAEACWERLNPPLDPEDPDTRAAPLANMLDDPVRGLCFPNLIRSVPILGRGTEKCSYTQWKRMRSAGDDSAELADALLHASDPDELESQIAAADACMTQLQSLRQVLTDKLGEHAPGFCYLEEALGDLSGLAAHALSEVRIEPPPSREETAAAEDESGEGSTTRGVGDEPTATEMLRSRKDAYRRIEQAARYLQRLEPHSPVPLLVLRAVDLSKLPFPELIRQFVREENILSEMYRELGVNSSAAECADSG